MTVVERDAICHLRFVKSLAEATGRLNAAGVDAPKLVAQVLLAHALGVPRASVVISPPTTFCSLTRLSRFARSSPAAWKASRWLMW